MAKTKSPARKASAKPKKGTAIQERYTKSQIITEISEKTDLTKVQVDSVLNEMSDLIERHIKKRACGEFILPGLFKITTQKKPATKARKGINPFTGEEMMFKAKPASTSVKIRTLKKLKDMAL